jgi:hypothetical protein
MEPQYRSSSSPASSGRSASTSATQRPCSPRPKSQTALPSPRAPLAASDRTSPLYPLLPLLVSSPILSLCNRGQRYLAGANILDIASIGVSNALIQANESVMAAAYGFIHKDVVLHDVTGVDGIKGDGSFQQHVGLIYNGDYGDV